MEGYWGCSAEEALDVAKGALGVGRGPSFGLCANVTPTFIDRYIGWKVVTTVPHGDNLNFRLAGAIDGDANVRRSEVDPDRSPTKGHVVAGVLGEVRRQAAGISLLAFCRLRVARDSTTRHPPQVAVRVVHERPPRALEARWKRREVVTSRLTWPDIVVRGSRHKSAAPARIMHIQFRPNKHAAGQLTNPGGLLPCNSNTEQIRQSLNFTQFQSIWLTPSASRGSR